MKTWPQNTTSTGRKRHAVHSEASEKRSLPKIADRWRTPDGSAIPDVSPSRGNTRISAPVDGTVGARSLRVGQFVQAGTQLMAVVPLDAVYVVANFKETQLTHVRNGQPVEIEIDSFHGTKLRGHVDSLSPASGLEFALLPPDNATGNFTKIVQRVPVRIRVPADVAWRRALRPGMSVVVSVDTKSAPEVARLPNGSWPASARAD